MPIGTSYTAEFRRRIQDVRASRRAFGFAVTDPSVTSAIAEITNGHLIVTVIGGTAASLDFDLTNPKYDTIGALYNIIHRIDGYRASLDEDANRDHPSIDLEPFGPLNIGPNMAGVDLVHHVFSDGELDEVIRDALRRHNPSMTLATMPPQEWAFVLPLAHAQICRVQAYDSSKRKGLDRDVTVLQSLAESYERQYKDDTTRLARALQSPKETNSNIVDEGDVMLGKNFRRSLRTGFMSPLSSTIAPDSVVLLEPDDHDVEDDNIRVNWQRNKNLDFYSYELWMDTVPDVVRTREGGLVFAGTPTAYLTTEDTRQSGAVRQTTSTMVFRSFGANSNSQRSSFSTFVEEFGQLIRSFAVSGLESETDYYFRLYIINLNYVAASSNVVRAKTKPLRARFLPILPDPSNPSLPSGMALDKTIGPPGTSVVATLNQARGAFTADHKLKMGEKEITPVITNAGYTLTFTVPSFQNFGQKDLAIISPTHLVDVMRLVFTVTAP